MADILKNLLDKSNNQKSSWYDIANAWSQSNNRDTKSLRNILLAQTLFGMKEFQMQQKVQKNLKSLERERVFDLGGMNQKWEAYQDLIATEKAYKGDSNYFKKQALAKYNEMHPDFNIKTALESEIADRNKEIEDYATALLNNHTKKVNTGNFDVKMTKEQFYQPFNDYYNQRAEEINAPKNRSLVHAGWNRITEGRKKVDPTAPTLEDRRKVANRGTFGYLVDPDEIKPRDEIALFRNPNEFVMTTGEMKEAILMNQSLPMEVRQSLIETLPKGTMTRGELKDHVVIETTDFDAEKDKLQRAYNMYDNVEGIDETNRPKVGTESYKHYIRKRNNYAALSLGIGSKRTNEYLNILYQYQDAMQDPDANQRNIKRLETELKAYEIDTIDKAIIQVISTSSADADYLMQNDDYINAFDPDDRANAEKLYFKNKAAAIRDMIEQVMGN